MSSRRDPKRLSSALQPTFEQETTKSGNNSGWPDKPHSEAALHEFTTQYKYDQSLGSEGNKSQFTKYFIHPMAESVLETPTFSDLKWWNEEGTSDAFSSGMYDALNDFESYLHSVVKDHIDDHFQSLEQSHRSKLIANTLRLLRCVPAGSLDTKKFSSQIPLS